MPGTTSRVDNLNRLTTTVDDFCGWIESLPARETRAQSWGPREVLAHLVYWHEHYLLQSRRILAGKPCNPPSGRFVDMNAGAVKKFRTTPIPLLTKRFQLANRHLCRLAQTHAPREIIFSIKQGSKPWRLSELIPAVEAHIRKHKKELIKTK